MRKGESFVHAERGDVQTAEGIDRNAVFARLDVPEDDQVGTDAETARRERLSIQRIALPVAESADRGVFGDAFLLSSTYKCNFLGADNKQ